MRSDEDRGDQTHPLDKFFVYILCRIAPDTELPDIRPVLFLPDTGCSAE